MKLYDLYSEEEYTIPEVYREWLEQKKSEPWNHAESFRAEWFDILMDTINGRNDCEVVGPSARELGKYIEKLRMTL